MRTHQHRFLGRDSSFHQDQVFFLVHIAGIDMGDKVPTVASGQAGLGHMMDQGVMTQAVLDQLSDGSDLEAVLDRELLQVRQPRHGAVVPHDLADDASWLEPSQPCQIDCPLGLAGTHQYPSTTSPEGENVPRHDQVFRSHVVTEGSEDGHCPVFGRDAAGHSVPGVDGHCERGTERGRILGYHHR